MNTPITAALSLSAAWRTAMDGAADFFSAMQPAALWAIPALAAALAFFFYFRFACRPRQNSLEWIAMEERRPRRLTLSLPRHPMKGSDVIPMLLVTMVYAATAFFGLGRVTSPESWVTVDESSVLTFSYADVVEVDEIAWFTVIGTGSYTLEYSADGEHWGSVELEQEYNDLLKWNFLPLTETEDEEVEPHGVIAAKMFRLTAADIDREEGLWLGELVLRSNGAALTPVYADDEAAPLFDEPGEWTEQATYLNSSYFDEIYHVRTAIEHLEGVYPYEVSHPPLGKLILSLGMLIFGVTPFGWRFMGTLFGVLMLPVLYIFLKNLFGKTAVAFCGTCLFAFDFMHLVQTRIATIDTYGVFFILLSYYFMYRWLAVPAGAKLRHFVLPLFLSGLFWGIGCACKWTVVYAGIGLALLWLLGLICKGKEWSMLARQHPDYPLPRFSLHVIGTFFLSLLFFVAVPAAVYIAAYIPYALARGGLTAENLLTTVWDNQVFMFTYHRGVHDPHPYSSDWYQWIVDGRPILYYRDLTRLSADGTKSLFASFNNPLVSWTGLGAFFVTLWESFRRKNGRALFILVAILSQFVPWLAIGRVLFAYHYFPTLLFLVFAIALMMDRMLERRRKGCRLAVYGLTGYAVILYGVFYPALTGLYVPAWYSAVFLRWFPSWPL